MGLIGREIFGFGQMLSLVFLIGSHVLTFTVAMNTITGYATCSIVFSVVGMAISCILSIPRTLSGMTWLALACKSNPNPIRHPNNYCGAKRSNTNCTVTLQTLI